MGTSYDCGCRQSMGTWYLCQKHEEALLGLLEMKPEKNHDLTQYNKLARLLKKDKLARLLKKEGIQTEE